MFFDRDNKPNMLNVAKATSRLMPKIMKKLEVQVLI